MRARWPWAVCAISIAFGTTGCKRKDAAKCDEALGVARKSADVADFALARQWREYAYKHCEDSGQLQALDKEIVDKERAHQEKEAAEAALRKEVDDLARVFADWAGQNKADPSRAAPPTCEGDEAAAEKKERWCNGQRSVSGKYTLGVRYWEAEPAAVQFSVKAPGELTCEALGPSSVINTLSGGARIYCDMTGGSLAGMKALLTRTPDGMQVTAFSPQYLARDAGLKAIVGG